MITQTPVDVIVTRPVRVVLYGQVECTCVKSGDVIQLAGEHLGNAINAGAVKIIDKKPAEDSEEKSKKGKK